MSSDLSIFAARLRDFIGISSADSLYLEDSEDPALRSHLDIEFNGMAIVLFGLQYLRNSAYRKICDARGLTPNSVTHWTQIPAVPAAAFKELELTSLPPEERNAVFHSSGTTQQRPSRHFHSAESLEVYEASLLPWFEWNVLKRFQAPSFTFQVLLLAPGVASAPNSSLVHMFDVVRRKLGASEAAFVGAVGEDGGWTLDFAAATAALEKAAEKGEKVLLLGTAFSFVHLLDHLRDRNSKFTLPAGSVVLETGGYKGRSRSMPKPELHAEISWCLGIPSSHLVCEYGMSELSSQAYQIGNRQPATGDSFRFPPWARAQVISPETGREVADGETGLLRICDLANVFSVMAIQTEDLAIRRGRRFELIGRAEQSEPRGCSLMAT